MILSTAYKIAIGAAIAIILALAGTVFWLMLANSKLETSLAKEQARCIELHGRLTVCNGNENRLQASIDAQNDALKKARIDAEAANTKANEEALAAHGRLAELIESDKQADTDAEGMNQWLNSLFY